MKNSLQTGVKLLDLAARLCGWPGKVAAWLCLGIIGLSVLSILAGVFRWHEFAQWKTPVFFLGTGFNSTSLIELQWHLFAVMMLFAGAYAQNKDAHVRVDILYTRMPPWLKIVVNAVGDLFFLLPFAMYIVFYSVDLVQFAYLTGEGSSEMGLTHRWVVKAILPLAMGLLGAQAAFRGVAGVLRLIGLSMGMSLHSLDCTGVVDPGKAAATLFDDAATVLRTKLGGTPFGESAPESESTPQPGSGKGDI